MSDQPWLFAGAGDHELCSIDPSHPDVEIGRYQASGPADVDRAVTTARRAAAAWAAVPRMERGATLHRIAEALRGKADVLAATMTRELGKPTADGVGEVRNAANVFDYYGALAISTVGPRGRSIGSADELSVMRSPLGVVAAITPWNFPVNIPSVKVAPAFAFGNAVVMKPAPLATASSLEYAETLYSAGLPDGLLAMVLGDGAQAAQELIGHQGTAAVSFTGSTGVGRTVLAAAGARNIKAQCEMGGKNALAVLADADLELAARLAVDGAFRLAGQRCTATSRVIVAQPVYDRFRELLLAATAQVRLGDPSEDGVLVGPLVSEARLAAVTSAVQSVSGAVRAGGHRATPGGLTGYFFEPTVLELPIDAPIARTELFGPVVSLHPCRDLDGAIAAVNSTDYGLTAAVFTKDLDAAARFVAEAQVGAVAVNSSTAGWEYQAPFGGWKDSGAGVPEQGPDAELFFTRQKTVRIHYQPHRSEPENNSGKLERPS